MFALTQAEKKRILRSSMLSVRDSLDRNQRAEKSRIITERVIRLLIETSAKSVLLYASFRSEVETWGIFEFCQNNSIKTAFPKVSGKELELKWVSETSQLREGFCSILEPCSTSKASLLEIDLILVPAVAFDIRGYRLGYGGGFYDRLLKDRISTAVGLAFDEQIVDEIPTEPFDQRVDIIITDRRSISCV